jgi:hypothetical protein
MAKLLLSVCLLAALTLLTEGAFSHITKWCHTEECNQIKAPWADRLNEADTLFVKSFAVPPRCGDKQCNIPLGETCATCPEDCGTCVRNTPITHCVKRNDFALTFDDGPSEVRSLFLFLLKRTSH